MSRFRHVELQYASRLLNHGPTILITSYDAQTQRRNVMAAAWSMPVEFAPPRLAIVVDKSAWTREIIERNGTFGIVVPGVAAASWTYAVGSISGRDDMRAESLRNATIDPVKVTAPMKTPMNTSAWWMPTSSGAIPSA